MKHRRSTYTAAAAFTLLVACCLLLAGLLAPSAVRAASSIAPNTWNVVGLDSNNVNVGPNHFPVGAKVCGGTPGAADTATLVWDAGGSDSGTYINLRPGSGNPVSFTYGADGCANAYFEAEVQRDSNAYDKTRRYHITAGGLSTPTPRQIYVEHLISQSRNGINYIKLNGSQVPSGGAMNLVVGNTYTIELNAFTATQGYNQLDSFINFPNTIFQVQAVSASYSADNSPNVPNPEPGLYADACQWDNDPQSPYYNSCVGGDYKAGGTVDLVYTVKIIAGGGTSQTLNTLINDFSGSSFHYNADYSTNFVTANIIDPSTVTIAKAFTPSQTNVNGVSTLTFTLANTNAGAISGVNFTDTLPTSPGAMVVAATPNAVTAGCGTPTFSPAAGASTISFSNGTIGGNSTCSIQVQVTAPAVGTYNNTTGHLFAGSVDTGKTASASLVVNTVPPPPPPTCGFPIAKWTMDPSQGTTVPPAAFTKAADVATATAAYAGTPYINAISTTFGNVVNSWGVAGGWAANTTGYPNSGAAPYFEFAVDSSKYTNVAMTFDYYFDGNWAASANNALYAYSKADGGGFSNIAAATVSNPGKTTWLSDSATAVSSGASTTTFRINAVGEQSDTGKNAAALYLDNIAITGCAVPTPPTVQKSFGTNPTAVAGSSAVNITITNTAQVAISGIAITDNLPQVTLQGTVATTSGSAVVTGSGTAFTSQLKANSVIYIGGGATAYTVKTVDSPSQLTLTANYAGTTGSGRAVTAGLTLSANATAAQCGGTVTGAAGATSWSLAGGTLAAGANCTITATVLDSVAGPITNVTGFVTATNTGINTTSTGSASATLTAVLPPIISQQFNPNPTVVGGSSTLTFEIVNPNLNATLTGVSFAETLPSSPGSMKVATPATFSTSPSCGTPTFAPTAGGSTLTFSGGTIAGGGICTVTVLVSVPAGITGKYTSSSGAVSATVPGAGNSSTADLNVAAANPELTLLKQVAATNNASTLWESFLAVAPGGSVYYRFMIENDGDVPLSSVYLADNKVNVAGCSWTDYDGNPITVTAGKFNLPVGVAANNAHIAVCTLGPIAAVAGTTRNDATAYGSYAGTQYHDDDYAIYATTGLTIAKSATQSYFTKSGDVINYSYLVTNSGSASLVGPVTVTDNKTTVSCPAVTTAGDGDSWLDPGESVTCTASYTVTAADVSARSVTNTASAATPAAGVTPAATSGTASVTVPLAADLTAVKTNNVGGSLPVGGSFVWTITVANGVNAGTASFSGGQALLTDDMPSSGASYALGAVATSGITGTITCALASSTVTCTAGGAVTIPPALTGTVAVTAGSATVTGTGTAFSSQLAAGSVVVIAAVPYTVLSVQSNSQLTLSAPYAGATATGLAIPASFSVPVTVTTSTTGSLVNPRAGGVCKANPAAIPELDATNNACANTVTVTSAVPALTVVKSFLTVSDPVHGAASPKPIPGAVVQYTIQVINSGAGAVDNGSLVVTDPIPAHTAMCVSTSCSNPPVAFSCSSTPACGLSYSYGSAVSYSSQPGGGAPYDYPPNPDASGFDANVTGVRINPSGSFAGAAGGNNASVGLTFRVRVQ